MPTRLGGLEREANGRAEVGLRHPIDVVNGVCGIDRTERLSSLVVPLLMALRRKIGKTSDIAISSEPDANVGIELAERVDPCLGNSVKFGGLALLGHDESLVTRGLPRRANADLHIKWHAERGRVLHRVFDDRPKARLFAGNHLEHEFVVHLEQEA